MNTVHDMVFVCVIVIFGKTTINLSQFKAQNPKFSYINDLLEQAERGAMIDPTLLHYCYAFISSHIYGSRPEGIVTVTLREIERFNVTKERLQSYLESQVTL